MDSQEYTCTKLWNIQYISLNLINILSNTGFSMIMTTISSYAVSFGASLAMAGTIASVLSFTALIFRPISGRIFDRFDKRLIFLISTVCYGLVVFGYIAANSIPALFVVRILHGIAFSISGTSTMALVSKFIPKQRVGEGLGYYNAGLLVGQAIGPAAIKTLLSAVGFSGLYVLVALMTSIPPLFCLFLSMPRSVTAPEPQTRDRSGSGREFSINDYIAKEYLLYAVICGVFSFYNGITNSYMLLVGEARGIEDVGLFFTVSSIVLIAARILTGKLSDRGNLTVLVAVSLLMTACSMLSAGLAFGLPLILVAAVFKAMGQGVGQVSLQGEVVRQADPARLGVVTGTIFIGNDVGNTLGPIAAGALSEHVGYGPMFFLVILVVLAAMGVFLFYQKKIGYRKPAPRKETPSAH